MEKFSTFTQTLISEATHGDRFKQAAIAQNAYDKAIAQAGGQHDNSNPEHAYLQTFLRDKRMNYNVHASDRHQFQKHYDPKAPNMGNPHLFYGKNSSRGRVNPVDVNRLNMKAVKAKS